MKQSHRLFPTQRKTNKTLKIFKYSEKTQLNEYSEAQSKLEEEKLSRRKAKSSKIIFKSFENCKNLPPFFRATKRLNIS